MNGLDLVTIEFANGTKTAVPWCGRLHPDWRMQAVRVLVDRMPMTFEEQSWFWHALPTLLAPLGSIKMVKQDA